MGRVSIFRHTKIKGSSLVETLIASVLIMVVFGIGLATISNILERTVKSNTNFIDRELNRLEYLYRHHKVKTPDTIEIQDWTIEIHQEKEGDIDYVVFQAKHKNNSKQKRKRILE